MTTQISNETYGVITGPSGRAMAQAMESSLSLAFQDHLTMERFASASYFANSIWFAERELRGFSEFYRQESINEQSHASQFADYLITRGQNISLQEIKSPKQNWVSIEELIAHSFQMERDVTTSLHQLYALAERSSDIRTTVFLDPTIESQLASEDEFAYLLGRVKFANNSRSSLLIIDGELSDGKITPRKTN